MLSICKSAWNNSDLSAKKEIKGMFKSKIKRYFLTNCRIGQKGRGLNTNCYMPKQGHCIKGLRPKWKIALLLFKRNLCAAPPPRITTREAGAFKNNKRPCEFCKALEKFKDDGKLSGLNYADFFQQIPLHVTGQLSFKCPLWVPLFARAGNTDISV